ncbi:hypothetical protein KAX02_08100 [candidate division WOR-3 bacterium]|nr:hypothetical protein [candidate division WOR-3 bacterium]
MELGKDVITDKGHVKGFVSVEKFEGQVTTIELSQVKRLVELLKVLEKSDFEKVAIGVENDMPLLLFLDADRKVAYAIAPYLEK